MARRRSGRQAGDTAAVPNSGATIGHEAELWAMADALRGSMDAAEYKHVVLGLVFLQYISDAFQECHAAVLAQWGEDAAEDRDEYTAENLFWIPAEARWAHLRTQARQPTVGLTVDQAMAAIERDNPTLKDVLPRDYARPALDKGRLGQLIDLLSSIRVGDEDARSRDVLGRVYEYFLSQFASAEGKKGGEFYTPRCVVSVLVVMLAPYRGRVYDPCCGSSGMFVQSMKFVRAHASGNGNGGKAKADISICGQESNYTTWRLAKMNLAIRGIEGQIAHGDSFHNDRHPDLKANYILANPPFNVSDWGGERLADVIAARRRCRHGAPAPAGDEPPTAAGHGPSIEPRPAGRRGRRESAEGQNRLTDPVLSGCESEQRSVASTTICASPNSPSGRISLPMTDDPHSRAVPIALEADPRLLDTAPGWRVPWF